MRRRGRLAWSLATAGAIALSLVAVSRPWGSGVTRSSTGVVPDAVERWIETASEQVGSLVAVSDGHVVLSVTSSGDPGPGGLRDLVDASFALQSTGERLSSDFVAAVAEAVRRVVDDPGIDPRPLQVAALGLRVVVHEQPSAPPALVRQVVDAATRVVSSTTSKTDVLGIATVADAVSVLRLLAATQHAQARQAGAVLDRVRIPCVQPSGMFNVWSTYVALDEVGRTVCGDDVRIRREATALLRSQREVLREPALGPAQLAYVQAASRAPAALDDLRRDAAAYVADAMAGRVEIDPSLLPTAVRTLVTAAERLSLRATLAPATRSRLRTVVRWGGHLVSNVGETSRVDVARALYVGARGGNQTLAAAAKRLTEDMTVADAAGRLTDVEAAYASMSLVASKACAPADDRRTRRAADVATAAGSNPFTIWRWAALRRATCDRTGLAGRVSSALGSLRRPDGLFGGSSARGPAELLPSFNGAVAWCLARQEAPEPSALARLLSDAIEDRTDAVVPVGDTQAYVGIDRTYAIAGLAAILRDGCEGLVPAL